jgi:hypothetical protein
LTGPSTARTVSYTPGGHRAMPGQCPDPTPIYRLIHADNLAVCLSRGALHAPNYTPQDGLLYRTIHREDIQVGRRVHELAVGPRGTIHDYVPFYFGPRSVMLYQLATGWVPGYQEGQEPLIHLVSDCQAVAAAGIGFAFSDGHGLARFTAWYAELADLDRVDWDAVYARQWRDTPDDMDRQRRKQAEFLVHRSMPWGLISEVGVYNDAARERAEAVLASHGRGSLPVRLRPEWYY